MPDRSGSDHGRMASSGDDRQHLLRIRRILERRIVPSLITDGGAVIPGGHGRAGGGAGEAELIDALVAMTLQGREDEARRELAVLHEAGWTIEDLQLGLLAPAAEKLGRYWEMDSLSFVDVTVAMGMLHRLLSHAWSLLEGGRTHGAEGLTICMFPEPGAEHTFGAAMAARFFERAGWRVEFVPTASPARLRQVVTARRIDALGLSIARREMTAQAADLLAELREAARPARPVAVGGGPALRNHPDLAAVLGLDAVLCDISAAPAEVAQLVHRQRRYG